MTYSNKELRIFEQAYQEVKALEQADREPVPLLSRVVDKILRKNPIKTLRFEKIAPCGANAKGGFNQWISLKE